MEDNNFTTREWIFVFIIASIVQGVVWYASFVNAGNASALTYVSFSGTLISIILAVLAIGYTYGESVAQKNKSDNVASQISSLNDVIKNVKFETKHLEDISKISEELSSFHSHFKSEMEGTKKSVGEISKAFYDLVDSNQILDKLKDPEKTTLDENVLMKVLLVNRTPLMEICLLIIIVSKRSESDLLSPSKTIQSTVSSYLNKLEKKYKREYESSNNGIYGIRSLIYGGSSNLFSILAGLQFIYLDQDEVLCVKKDFKEYAVKLIKDDPKKGSSFYGLIRDEILMDIDQFSEK